jgi:hypothetical protein
MEWILFAVAVWWTITVVFMMVLTNETSIDGPYSFAIAIGLIVFWPITAVLAIPALLYQAAVASTSRMRIDLNNRGLLREFEKWLADNKKDP